MAVMPAQRIYEGTRIPSPCPTILRIDPSEHDLDDILTINFGPNHPSTHGVLRLIVDLDGWFGPKLIVRMSSRLCWAGSISRIVGHGEGIRVPS